MKIKGSYHSESMRAGSLIYILMLIPALTWSYIIHITVADVQSGPESDAGLPSILGKKPASAKSEPSL